MKTTATLLAMGIVVAALPARAQDYPNRPISIVSAQASGGASDTVVRAVTIIRGRPSGSGRDLRCRGAPMDFTAFGALVLNFRHGRFVGWVLNPGARPLIETDLGLGIGTPRDQVGYGGEDLTSTRNTPLGPQFEVSAGGLWLGQVDLAWPESRLVVEYEGAYHFEGTQIIKDDGRYARLVAAGWTVIRLLAADLRDLDAVVRRIKAAL